MNERIRTLVRSRNFGLIIFLAAIIVFFQIISGSTYLTTINIRSILNSTAIISLLAIGAGLVILSGQIDLSAGYVGTLSGMIIAYLIVEVGVAWFLAFLAALVIAMIIGFINATLVHKLRFQAFIATIAMGSVCEGLVFSISSGKTINIADKAFASIGTSRLFVVIPSAVLFSILVVIICGIILSQTKFGRKIYLVGGNDKAARLTGLNPLAVSYILFICNAAISCIAGCLVASRVMAGTAVGIIPQNFAGITAAILGGVSFGGGSGGISGVIIGLLIISCFSNGLTVMRLEPQWVQLAFGVLLLLALTLDFFRSKGVKKTR